MAASPRDSTKANELFIWPYSNYSITNSILYSAAISLDTARRAAPPLPTQCIHAATSTSLVSAELELKYIEDDYACTLTRRVTYLINITYERFTRTLCLFSFNTKSQEMGKNLWVIAKLA